MTIELPEDYQAIFENDVWNVFHSLGLGYGCFLIEPSNGKTAWMIPPQGSKYSSFYMDFDVIQWLLDNGYVEELSELPANAPHSAETAYQLSDKGRGLYSELESAMFIEGERLFVEKARPKKP